jgi:hypothetical protein
MFENKYAWEYSAVYMTGIPAGIGLFFIFTLSLIVVYVILPLKLRELIIMGQFASSGKSENANAREEETKSTQKE